MALSPTPAVSRILAKLEKVRANARGWVALCPAHEDGEASLSIGIGTDGRVVLKCHAGCDTPLIVASLGLTMRDLFDDAPERPPNGPQPVPARGVTTRPFIVKSYDYRDLDGRLLFQTCRLEPKTFRQRHPDAEGNWVWNLEGVTPVLYRLPEIVEAVAEERRVFVVEGEKDADTLAELGYAATTSPMGAGKWRDQYAEPLEGADVVVLPDNDDVGRAHADTVARSLTAHRATVRIVALPHLREHGDVSDWLANGGSIDQLETLIGSTPRWGTESPPGVRRTRWRLDEVWENDSIMRPPPPIVPRLAWAGRSTLLAAREKSGKSTLTGYMAAQVTLGGSFLGDRCGEGVVLVIGLEEYLGDAARRFRHFGANATRIFLVDSFSGDPRQRPHELLSHIDAIDPVLVIIDSLAAYSHGQIQDDNNASQMAGVVQPLTDLSHSRGVALVIVHHARKSDGRARGSTAITAGTDVVAEYFIPDASTDPTLRRMLTVGRVPVQPVYDLRFDGDHFTLANGEQSAPIESRILAIVRDRPSISIIDLADAAHARKDDVSRAVRDMLAKGTLANLSESSHRFKLAVPAAANLAFLRE